MMQRAAWCAWLCSARGITLVIGSVAALIAPPTRPAFACSAGPDYNPVAESEVIVVGRLTGWREADASASSPDGSLYLSIRVTMAVERALKGSTPPAITIVDRASLLRIPAQANRPEEMFWAGSAGACGSFDDDPTGRYAVMRLWREADGTYRPNRIHTFYLGDQPPVVVWPAIVARLTQWGPVSLPLTGAAVRARYDHDVPSILVASLVGGIAILLIMSAPVVKRGGAHQPRTACSNTVK